MLVLVQRKTLSERIADKRRQQPIEELERKWNKAKGRNSNAFWSAEWLDLAHARVEITFKWLNGVGDWAVPDKIFGAYGNSACLIHDCDWSTADGSEEAFHSANERLRRNLKSLVKAQLEENSEFQNMALCRCDTYFFFVDSAVGWAQYQPINTDPWQNPVIAERLKRLAMAAWQMPNPGEALV